MDQLWIGLVHSHMDFRHEVISSEHVDGKEVPFRLTTNTGNVSIQEQTLPGFCQDSSLQYPGYLIDFPEDNVLCLNFPMNSSDAKSNLCSLSINLTY